MRAAPAPAEGIPVANSQKQAALDFCQALAESDAQETARTLSSG